MYGLRWCDACQFNYMPIGEDKDKHRCKPKNIKTALISEMKVLKKKIGEHKANISNSRVDIGNCEGYLDALQEKIGRIDDSTNIE